jgi:hypothetical protein
VSFPSVVVPSFPAYGTLISTGTEPVTLNFTYQEPPYTTGSFQWGWFPYYTRADGAGGTYLDFSTGYSNGTETATLNQVVDDTVAQTNYRIIYNGGFGFTYPAAGTYNECLREGVATGATGSGDTYVSINYTNYISGSYTYVERGNGTCGLVNDYSYSYTSYGTLIFSEYSYYDSGNMVDVYAYYYHDGAGGYYVTYS